MNVSDMTPEELQAWFDASECDEFAQRDDGTDDVLVATMLGVTAEEFGADA